MKGFVLIYTLALAISPALLTAQAANDECIDALALPGELEYCSEVGQFNNDAATVSFPDYPACIDEEDEHTDVWFSFVAQATDASISVVGNVTLQPGGTILTPQFLLYAGACNDLTEIGCVSPITGFNQVSGIFTGLEPGQTYYLNVGARFGRTGSFQLCINQFNSVPEPSGDCETGVVLCDKSSFAVNFLSGVGNVNDDLGDLLCNEANCGGSGQVGESNAAWYKWTCDEAGSLTFDIDPLGGPNDDLDFLLYELPNGLDDCASKVNIRCMLSGESQGNSDAENFPCLNNTGLSLFDEDAQEECGCQPGNNNFAQAIDMVAGRSYALVIMNFSNSGDGFQISWGGTGTFLGPEASFVADLGQVCVGETVTFSDNSSSLDPIQGYVWNFGPNASPQTATGPGPHEVFFVRPGNQSVLLEVETSRGCLVTEIQNNLEVICCPDQFGIMANVEPSTCPGDQQGSITLDVGSNFAPFTYAWSTGANTANITGLNAGDYSVTVTDQSTCSVSQTFTVSGPPPFAFDTLVVMPTCDGGQDGALTLVTSGGTPPYEFNFNGQGFQPSNTIAGLAVGTVNVVIRDANDCTNEQDIFVNELVLELDPAVTAIQEPRCNGEANGSISVVIGNGSGPFQYDFNQGQGFQTDAVLNGIPAGGYAVNVRDANGCRGDFTFEVPDPPALQLNLEPEDISCFGQQDGRVTAQPGGGRPGYVFQWSNGPTDAASITGLAAGTYSLTITDTNGCPLVAEAAIAEPPEIFAELVEVTDNVCFGEENGSVRLTARGGTPGFTFSADGQTFVLDSLLTNLAAADYDLVVMDSEGCTDTVAATVEQPAEFVIDAGPGALIELGFDTTLVAVSNYDPVSYSWGPDTVLCLSGDCSRVLVGPFVRTTYVVTGVNAAGCLATASVLVRVADNKPVYIPNAISPNGDGVNDGFTLFSGPAVAAIEEVRIFDRWGGLVFEARDIPPNEPNLGWNGLAGDRSVNPAVFVYQFRVRFLNGEIVEYAGDVTVVR